MALDHTRITKYNQQYYEEDKFEALAVQNMDMNDAPQQQAEVQDDDERIYNEEMMPLNMLPDDDDYGDDMDGDEMY